jgi:hypothetical protein
MDCSWAGLPGIPADPAHGSVRSDRVLADGADTLDLADDLIAGTNRPWLAFSTSSAPVPVSTGARPATVATLI